MNKTIIMLLALGLGSASAAGSYVSSNAATKTATLIVNASEGTVNGGLNFNGVVKAAKSFTVPAGWNVVLKFKNLGAMGHSAAVVKGTAPALSVTPKDVAFAGAATSKLNEGLGTNQGQSVKFKAGKAGSYLIVCGAPGHGLAGQYLGLKVVAGAKTASYQ